jgi:hypothetical protein
MVAGRQLLKPHAQNRAFEAIRQKLWIPSAEGPSRWALKVLPEK